MGIPSVVTDVRGCRQTVDDGVTGRIVPVRSSQALADALLELLRDDAKRAAYGRAARQKALREFDEREVFDRILGAYDRLLRQRAASFCGRPSARRRRSTDVVTPGRLGSA